MPEILRDLGSFFVRARREVMEERSWGANDRSTGLVDEPAPY